MRSTLLLAPPLFALVLVLTATSRADDLATTPLVDERTQAAVEGGLRYLKRTQNEDGSWSSNAGKKINETYRPFTNGVEVHHVGITSLAILAYLAGGHLPGRGPYGATLERAVSYVLHQVQPEGYIAANQTRMYSHAFATLALAEVYGVTRDDRVRKKLVQAVEFTVKCQNETGGWRYVPFTKDSDMSVTVCQVVALRAARNVGIKVPRATINRALHYVIDSANTRSNARWPRGSFLYQHRTQEFNRDSFSLTAAGLTTIFQAGLYDDKAMAQYIDANGLNKHPPPSIDDIISYMRQTYRKTTLHYANHYFYYYGNYYAAQAMYQIGVKRPRVWRAWYAQVRDDLLSRLRRGYAGGRAEPGEVYWISNIDTTNAFATATALLILQFPLDQLPIHQR